MVVFVFHFTDEVNDEDQCPGPQMDLGLGFLTPTPVLFATTFCSFGLGPAKDRMLSNRSAGPRA